MSTSPFTTEEKLKRARQMAALWRLQRQFGGGFPKEDVDEFLEAFPDADSEARSAPLSRLGVNERWEQDVPHDPRSVELFRAIERLDLTEGGDYFCFKSGGDGDNGEHLMYLLDVYFAEKA